MNSVHLGTWTKNGVKVPCQVCQKPKGRASLGSAFGSCLSLVKQIKPFKVIIIVTCVDMPVSPHHVAELLAAGALAESS